VRSTINSKIKENEAMAVAYDLFLAKGSSKLFPSLPLTSLPFQSSSCFPILLISSYHVMYIAEYCNVILN
jgi:hypothetical protein